MKDQLDRLESKMDKTIDSVAELSMATARVEVHIEQNTKDIAENKDDWKAHMYRTDLNETRIIRLEKIEQWLRGATWITMGLAGILLAVAKLLEK